MPDIAKVFRFGNSQAVRLPNVFRSRAEEVEILRRGDEVVLREKPRSPADVLGRLPPWPDDMDIPDLPPGKCEVF